MRTREKAMIVKLRKGDFVSLRLNDSDNYTVACAAFYLGFGMERIRGLTRSLKTDPERLAVVSTAKMLGWDERDKIDCI